MKKKVSVLSNYVCPNCGKVSLNWSAYDHLTRQSIVQKIESNFPFLLEGNMTWERVRKEILS
jgi:hypothetical protein